MAGQRQTACRIRRYHRDRRYQSPRPVAKKKRRRAQHLSRRLSQCDSPRCDRLGGKSRARNKSGIFRPSPSCFAAGPLKCRQVDPGHWPIVLKIVCRNFASPQFAEANVPAAIYATALPALAFVLPALPRVSLFRAKKRHLLRFRFVAQKPTAVSHAERTSSEERAADCVRLTPTQHSARSTQLLSSPGRIG